MSLSLALNNALSGLNVNQRALAVLSQNISNANTPGYSRQTVDQAAVYVGGIGEGVRVEDVSRKVDTYLQRAISTQNSQVGESDIINEYYKRSQILLGEPGSQNSVDEYLVGFFNAMKSLSETPELPSFRNNAVNAGVTLARELSSLARGVEDLRYQADKDIKEAVNYINTELDHLYALNQAINRAYALGTPTAGLLDQRDMSIKNISEYMNVQAYYKEDGQINLYTSNGIAMLDDNRYRLNYNQAPSVNTFIDNGTLSPLTIVRVDANNNQIGTPTDLISSGTESSVTTVLQTGKLKGLKDLRDTLFPNFLSQLDTLAAAVRDSVNDIHNDGSGFPGATSLTGTRLVSASDFSDWSGKVLIGVVDENGQPVTSRYDDEEGGVRPLTIDLSEMDSGQGAGKPTVQAIIDEINAHFGIPQNKAEVGNINNIRLTSDSNTLPGIPPQFIFDFELDNISASNGDFFVTGVTVFDDLGANITSTTSTIPSVTLDPGTTYTTTALSNIVTVHTASAHGFVNGQRIYLGDPGGAVDGIPAAELNNYFTISNVTGTTFDIVVNTPAVGGGPQSAAGTVSALPKYDTVLPGEISRTKDKGMITADLIGNPNSTFYTINVTVGVDDGNGGIATSTVTYRVNNNATNLLNDHFNATAVAGGGALVSGNTNQGVMKAILVDENGVELPTVNGNYTDQPAYLKLVSLDSTYRISISELDSKQLGLPNALPAVAGTDRGFSHYFELNNFFKSNQPTLAGDTLTNSAIHLAVEDRLLSDPNLVTTGKLALSNQPANSTVRTFSLATNPFSTTLGSPLIRISSASPHGLQDGDIVTINYNGLPVNGVTATDLNRTFTVSNVTATTFDITVAVNATSTGTGGGSSLTAGAQPINMPRYTYERYIGDNSSAKALSDLGVLSISFDAAGGLPSSTQSFNGYAGSMLGFAASSAAAASNKLDDSSTLLEGFTQRANSISGVNLDEELANTIIYQNAYTASARVISVTSDLFDALLGIFR